MKILKQAYSWLKKSWKAETPKIARLLQAISIAIAALPLYYSVLPEEFKATVKQEELRFVTITGAVCVFLFQFFRKRKNDN